MSAVMSSVWDDKPHARTVDMTNKQWALLLSVLDLAIAADRKEAAERRETGIGDADYRDARADRIAEVLRKVEVRYG